MSRIFIMMSAMVLTILLVCGWASEVQAQSFSASKQLRPLPDQFGIFHVPAHRRSLRALDELQVGWIRLQLQMGERKKKHLLTPLKTGHGLWLTLYHRDQSNINETGTIGFRRSKRGGFPPSEPRQYQALIQETLEPYVQYLQEHNKAPGNWLIIQINNEVVPTDVAPDRPKRFWHGTGKQYLETLSLAYDAVKAVDPSIPVAAAGISSGMMELVLSGKPRVVTWCERLLREGRFDWADVHLRHAIDTIPNKVAWIRERWNGPLGSTEFAGPDERTGTVYTEEGQAKELAFRMKAALQAGVNRIFWAGLVENDFSGPIHAKEGLLAKDTWRRKPVFEAYRQFIQSSAP